MYSSVSNTFPLFYFKTKKWTIEFVFSFFLPVLCKPGISFRCRSARVVSGTSAPSNIFISCRTACGFLYENNRLKRKIKQWFTRWSLSAGIGGKRLGGTASRSSSSDIEIFSFADVVNDRSIYKFFIVSFALDIRSFELNKKQIVFSSFRINI